MTSTAEQGGTGCGRTVRAVHLGIDIGSTTVKATAIDAQTHEVLFRCYRRHHAKQTACLQDILRDAAAQLPSVPLRAALCGSGGMRLAQELNLPYVQEVVANTIAVRELHPQVRTAIELGGQDAKMVFFSENSETGELAVTDMRMNGSCAGGTGAFLDEIAKLLDIPVTQFDLLAAQGSAAYAISGRCGVYAKTDIQPLLNQGAPKTDIARSTFHAVAKQTIGGLAQGLEIRPPVIFQGGPLTFNPTLVDVFAERLGLTKSDRVVPVHPETFVAFGAALALDSLFANEEAALHIPTALAKLQALDGKALASAQESAPLFANALERAAFQARHSLPCQTGYLTDDSSDARQLGETYYLGIDSGSTTTKLVLMDENEQLAYSFYAPNEGDPLNVARNALIAMRDRCRAAGIPLNIAAVGTTGYGEALFYEALQADSHVLETIAHARAARACEPNVSFVLDIGGQDMKALWVKDGIITNIVVNEACSSGCGSFLSSFASTLDIPYEGIAEAAARAQSPANLGSRCTVFMNSCIVSEQRAGKTPDDIMAGLCRSIVENVFTKVIRIQNKDSLGEHVVVQGGTFLNDAVLRAFEHYLERPVTRAPYPGLMGALGAAMVAKEQMERKQEQQSATEKKALSRFIGLDALDSFSYTQTQNLECPFCANHCNRSLVEFSNGATWVTGNRCPRGEVLGDPRDAHVREKVRHAAAAIPRVPNLFAEREQLLFREWPCTLASETPRPASAPLQAASQEGAIVVGLPRVLSFWDTMPFWSTLFRSLGCKVKFSHPSNRKLYESGLCAVASDTVCFPAKLVHGHVRDLAKQGVSFVFMPAVTTVPPENTASTSQSMCAVVKGYPLVIRNSDNPTQTLGVPLETPLFHWFTEADRNKQLGAYLQAAFGVSGETAGHAIAQGDAAQTAFRTALEKRGAEVLQQVEQSGSYAVVLTSRPYQNDSLVNHDLPAYFTEAGIPVLTADAVPHARSMDLSASRLDIVNNYHARMLSSALAAARNPHLEYAQVVSFGCGHDAYLTDEIIRLMAESGDKTPLVLKVDESDAQGPLRIRIRSFIETLNEKRLRECARQTATSATDESERKTDSHLQADPAKTAQTARSAREALPDPYPVKFTKHDRATRTVLVPNTSHAFCRLMTAAFRAQGLRAEALPVGREEAINLGKRYVHNDICFPAQVVIGEALAALRSGKYHPDRTAIGMGKYVGDCRLTHYSALLRKALDDAGFAQVPIVTNDDADQKNLHPGFRLNTRSAVRIATALPMIDALEELLRKMRPYELVANSANKAFEAALDFVIEGLESKGVQGAKQGFQRAISRMKEVAYDRSKPRPRVLIVGEYLLNFHPGANNDIEDYLERNGLEVVEARMTDVIRKVYFYQDAQVRDFKVKRPAKTRLWNSLANRLFERAHDITDRIAASHPLYERATRIHELAAESDPVIHRSFDAGEGILIPGEILHHAKRGMRSFVILQPFGCLPNHVVGRGIAKRLRELYPDAQILSLDYDPDVSFANVENRLQMLIMQAKAATA